MRRLGLPILVLLLAVPAWIARGEVPPTAPGAFPVQWPANLFDVPRTFETPKECAAEGVESAFLEGPAYQGKPTRIFVYFGIPEQREGKTCPAMVLIHGGGGTAFAEWVREWNRRGYAAIAMDTCGALPVGKNNQHPRHDAGGPSGWGGFEASFEPITDQWVFHAVSAVMLAHSFLRSRPGVDADRIGVTGISWGGFLTCIVAAVDPRFKCAVPVYGCGFLGEDSAWGKALEKQAEQGRKWLDLWDPKHYLPAVSIPMLWVDGTNDFAYPLDSLQKSYQLPRGPRTLCTRLRMPHGHGGLAQNAPEIVAFADHILRAGRGLIRITAQGREGKRVWASYDAADGSVKAELLFTKDEGAWKERTWEAIPAIVSENKKRVEGLLPEGAKVYYLNLVDPRELIVSSEHEEIR